MKTISFIILLLTLPFKHAPIDKLIGDWKVVKLETGEERLFPTKREYHLYISETNITFDLETNGCGTDGFTVDDSTISIKPICTANCCEGRNDPIATEIDYNGKYAVDGSELTITNAKGTLYLTKVTSGK